MRIQINVDVAENEIGLATELLSVLRSITDEVSVRTQKGVSGATSALHTREQPTVHSSSATSNGGLNEHKPPPVTVSANAAQRNDFGGSSTSATSKAAAMPVSAASAASIVPPGFTSSVSKASGATSSQHLGSRLGSSESQVGSLPGPRAASAASTDIPSAIPPASRNHVEPGPQQAPVKGPSSAPASALPHTAPLPPPKAGTAPSAAPPSAPTAKPASNRAGMHKREDIVAALRKMIEGLDTEDNYEASLDKVASNLKTVFENGNLGNGDEREAFLRFWDAFSGILWDPHRLQAQKSAVPFMNLLPRLPEDILEKTKEPLISQTMRRLTESRPVDTNRQEFFTDAEIFACIVTIQLVGPSGAVKTIIQMLGIEQKRAAAVTMLGKTVERSADTLLTEVDADTLAALKDAVDKIKEPIFQYDKSYVYECMEWGSPVRASAAPAKGKLLATATYKGHSESVYALAYDPMHSQLASAGKDGSIILWDSHGRVAQRLQNETEGCYYNGMAMHPSKPTLVAICIGGVTGPGVDILEIGPGCMNRRLQLQRSCSDLVSCVTCLPGSDLFAIGELHAGNDQSVVSIFDFNHLSSSSEPTATLKDEHGVVTCVGMLDTGSPNPNVMMSGAKDGTITVWDIRTQKPAIHMAVTNSGDDSAMVTTFDSQDCVVMAGSLNNSICQWDVRALRQAGTSPPQEAKTLDGTAILRIAFGPAAPQAAVSTLGGLYYMDPFVEGVQPSYRQASSFLDRGTPNYPDVRWGRGNDSDVLYAASLDGSIDVYKLGSS